MHVVAQGFAFTSKRGLINEGEKITEKDFASRAAFEKALKAKRIIEGKSKEQLTSDQEIAAAKQKKESAKKDVTTAQKTVAFAEEEYKKASDIFIGISESLTPIANLLFEKEKANKEIVTAAQALGEAESELSKISDPGEKEPAEQKVANAKNNLAQKAGNEYMEARDNLGRRQVERDKAEDEVVAAEIKVVNAKEILTLAEKQLENASAELKALEKK